MQLPRWDTDTRGRGVASAAALSAPVQRLLGAMDVGDWVTEQPEVHLLPRLEAALSRPGSLLRLLAARSDPDGTLVVDVSWNGAPPSRREQRVAVFTLIGAVAEASCHVRQQLPSDGSVFDIVTGMLDGDGPFASHGHSLRLQVISDGVKD